MPLRGCSMELEEEHHQQLPCPRRFWCCGCPPRRGKAEEDFQQTAHRRRSGELLEPIESSGRSKAERAFLKKAAQRSTPLTWNRPTGPQSAVSSKLPRFAT